VSQSEQYNRSRWPLKNGQATGVQKHGKGES
jgi:hypothetical protein